MKHNIALLQSTQAWQAFLLWLASLLLGRRASSIHNYTSHFLANTRNENTSDREKHEVGVRRYCFDIFFGAWAHAALYTRHAGGDATELAHQ